METQMTKDIAQTILINKKKLLEVSALQISNYSIEV